MHSRYRDDEVEAGHQRYEEEKDDYEEPGYNEDDLNSTKMTVSSGTEVIANGAVHRKPAGALPTAAATIAREGPLAGWIPEHTKRDVGEVSQDGRKTNRMTREGDAAVPTETGVIHPPEVAFHQGLMEAVAEDRQAGILQPTIETVPHPGAPVRGKEASEPCRTKK